MLIAKEYVIGNVPREHIIGTAPTLEQALRLVPGEVFLYEEDRDHPGHYDGASVVDDGARLITFTIEPTK